MLGCGHKVVFPHLKPFLSQIYAKKKNKNQNKKKRKEPKQYLDVSATCGATVSLQLPVTPSVLKVLVGRGGANVA